MAGEVELEMQSVWGICSQSLVYLPGATCLVAPQPIHKKQVLETPGPDKKSFLSLKVMHLRNFVLDSSSLNQKPVLQLPEQLIKIYCLMMDFFCRLELMYSL